MKKYSFRHLLEYAILRSAQMTVCLIPIAVLGAIVSAFFRIFFCFYWPLKRETVSRMREVFGADFPVKKIRCIARVSIWNMVMNYVEIMHAGKMNDDYLLTHLQGCEEAREKLRAIIAKHGGAVLALPHMGNWDFAGIACGSFGIPLMALARAQNNPLVEKWLCRNRLGEFEAADRRRPSSFIRIAHHLKSGGAFAILPDVRHNKPGVSVTVFGKPDVQLGKGMAKFARMANVPIVPLFMERLDASHHIIRLCEPLYSDLEAEVDADMVRLSQSVWNLFEAEIRAKPEQWFWYNRRWILTPLYTQTR
ncbi:MAG: lysophospholipid acyltransferase family protein [Kiritimatiellia bacterium]